MAIVPSNRDLAASCGMSEDHFIRRFKETLGKSPARYGMERRLEAASEMLVGEHLSIEEIAGRTGFVDRFHFSRAFKRQFQFAPGEYRRLQREDVGEFQS